jgi:hypothetical protein
MGRIRDAYEARFRGLLGQLRPRHLELGVQLLLERAQRLSERHKISLPRALAQVYARASERIERGRAAARRSVGQRCELAGSEPPAPTAQQAAAAGRPLEDRRAAEDSVEFVCDAGLGGLARWLRAAGYEAHWTPEISDDDLIREARRIPATLLTTDSLLMDRGVLRDGFIPALWVPPSLTKFEQLELVLRELRLPVRDPRCMSCGGVLVPVDKEAVRERIPPKTYRWRDEYFICSRCDKLFWHGTHWDRIGERLRGLPGDQPARTDRRNS